ncbi:hypothetical protein BEP19_00910 [Ammoniphilus oxalaticus]|uniref:SLH domain-containing protein n=1 Tax=Ammoniphilus oxalaticus TaxID=66863 RepID=A0A419SMK8_9BACL|nr:S-layer homology domain-containing protein [Ammoniphilus oxalaticus]RKD25536.1 hypothetical protein BEP19_00910 [Ammoniphilus oxalaticus]
MTKKVIAAVSRALVLFLALGVWVAGYAPATTAAAKRFSDVGPKQGWALQDITKMSLKGIIVGTPEGQFLPDQGVQQQQALVMVIKTMGYEQEAENYKGKDHSAQYKGVADWAKKYVSFAHQEDLLRVDEGDRFHGEYAASREWIAQLLVRMIDKEAEALAIKHDSRSFTDARDISKWADGYVKLAASDDYGLISGFPNDDGTFSFKPKENVTRAQMTVLISKAERFMSNPVGNELRGQILSVGDEWLIGTKDGNRKLKVTGDTAIFQDYKKVSSSVIKRFQPIYALYTPGKPDVAQFIQILDEDAAEEVITGTITKVVKPLKTVALTTSEGLTSFYLSDGVVYGSKDGTVKSIDDLNEGDTIELTFVGGQVSKAYLITGSAAGSSKGTIYEVDLTNNLITLQHGEQQSAKVYTLNKDATVQYPDRRATGLAGLSGEMEVEIKLKDNEVVEIKVTEIVEQGKIISVSADKKYITITSAGDQAAKVYSLATDAEITLQGTATTSQTIQAGDDVKLRIGSDGQIQTLNIMNRSAGNAVVDDGLIEGKVYAVDSGSGTVILEKETNGQKTYHPYDFGSTYDLSINGKWSTRLADIKKDMRAKVQLFEDKIVYFEVDNRLSGKVVRVDKDRRLLTLAHENGQQVPYYVDNNYDMVIRHQGGADLSDLELQDQVRVKLDENNRITDIAVQREFAYLVTDVYESSKRLNVKNEKGNSYSMTLNTNVELEVPGKSIPKITDFNKGDIVKASYLGDDLKNLAVLPSDKGMVTHVDQDKKQFTLAKNDGTTAVYTFNSGDVIEYGNNEYTQLNSLVVNDRVIVQTWLGGKKRLTKMQQVTEEFYYKDNNFIYAIENVRSYRYDPDLFVRGTDNRGITLDMLSKNDKIRMYRLDGIVYEVHKIQ